VDLIAANGRYALLGCVLAVALMPATTAAAHAGKRLRRCAPAAGVYVEFSSRAAQLYLDTRTRQLFACLRRGGRPLLLQDHAPIESENATAVAGAIVAYHVYSVSEPEIVVVNVATRRVIHRVVVRTARPHGSSLNEAKILSVVVTADGSVAWTQADSGAGRTVSPAEYGVYAVERDGFHVLSTELTSPPGPLRLAGTTVRWTQGGVESIAAIG
jgi:hypothetical protein